MMTTSIYDPKGLIQDAFAIDGISAPECRSIFLDWALGLPANYSVKAQAQAMIDHFTPKYPPTHPMMATLTAACQDVGPPRRRGGRAGRITE